MRLVVLHVPGCPNAPTLAARVAELVAGRARVEQRVVHDYGEAAALGMRGSPTLLVDGIDPFARADQRPRLSGRLYRDEAGAWPARRHSPNCARSSSRGPVERVIGARTTLRSA